MVEKKSGIKTSFKQTVAELQLPNSANTAVFRIFQEALTNIARHSNATFVQVVLKQESNSFILHIEENGQGFSSNENVTGNTWGLPGMKERAAMINGSFQIESIPGRGTIACVSFPINM